MRKLLLIILAAVLIPTTSVASSKIFELQSVDYPIIINSQEMTSDLPILNYNGNTYIPMRKVTEAMGADVFWDSNIKKAYISTYNLDSSTRELVLSAPLSIEIKGHVYTLSIVMYQDNMPGPSFPEILLQNKTKIIVTQDDGQEWSNELDIEKAWVINEKSAYEIEFSNQSSIDEIEGKKVLVKNSPYFPPSTFRSNVDVVVKLVDDSNDTYLLRTTNQNATESS